MVRPPSRTANRMPSSMTIGWTSFTVMVVDSPGATVSVRSDRVTTPVTSAAPVVGADRLQTVQGGLR
jgi:hypothetical protein